MDYVRNDGTVSRDDLIVDLEFLFFEKIRDKDFSYWSWFFKAANILKKEYFRNLWENGCFMGFVGKEKCLTLLEGQQVGDFLVRFSQSEEAAFAIAFYTPGIYVFFLNRSSMLIMTGNSTLCFLCSCRSIEEQSCLLLPRQGSLECF